MIICTRATLLQRSSIFFSSYSSAQVFLCRILSILRAMKQESDLPGLAQHPASPSSIRIRQLQRQVISGRRKANSTEPWNALLDPCCTTGYTRTIARKALSKSIRRRRKLETLRTCRIPATSHSSTEDIKDMRFLEHPFESPPATHLVCLGRT